MLNLGSLRFPAPAVMGILNVTPDSFSDGGRFDTRDAALRQAAAMAEEGAAIIDIGGESTRPGSRAVGAQEELDRVIPVIEAVRSATEVPISVTYFEDRRSQVSGNLVRYGLNALKIIARTARDFKPLRFFGTFAAIVLGIGFAMDLWMAIYFLRTGSFSPYKFVGFTGTALLLLGVLILGFALLADMLDRLRVNQERVLVVGVSVDEDKNLMSEFLLQHGIGFANVQDAQKRLAGSVLDIEVYPETFIVSPAGKIVRRIVGERDWNSQQVHDLLDAIERGRTVDVKGLS